MASSRTAPTKAVHINRRSANTSSTGGRVGCQRIRLPLRRTGTSPLSWRYVYIHELMAKSSWKSSILVSRCMSSHLLETLFLCQTSATLYCIAHTRHTVVSIKHARTSQHSLAQLITVLHLIYHALSISIYIIYNRLYGFIFLWCISSLSYLEYFSCSLLPDNNMIIVYTVYIPISCSQYWVISADAMNVKETIKQKVFYYIYLNTWWMHRIQHRTGRAGRRRGRLQLPTNE